MSTKTQYRVINVGSREWLTDWLDSETEAHAAAAEAEEHETQPDCSVESREVEAVEYTSRVDDHRFPFGHQHRASGLSVAATVEWRDGMPYATMTEAVGMPDGPPLQSDIDAALADIEAQAYAGCRIRFSADCSVSMVWADGEAVRVATQEDLDVLPVGEDLTDEEVAGLDG